MRRHENNIKMGDNEARPLIMDRFKLSQIENKSVVEFLDMMSDSWPPMDVFCSTDFANKSHRP